MADLRELSPGFWVDAAYASVLAQAGMDSTEGVFAFEGGDHLTKANLSPWRHRIRFALANGEFAYLKRYVKPPLSVQVKAWLQHGQRAFLSSFDRGPVEDLSAAGVSVPRTIACGGRWRGFFEACSFIITLELKNARSLEQQLPACFAADTAASRKARRAFNVQLADFVRRFHATGFRHRDLYLAHIFHSDEAALALIDLHRCFRPRLLSQRYRIKDLAQLHYSAPAERITRTDRLRFFRAYRQVSRLTAADKRLIRKIHAKAQRIARHDRRHGRTVPFESISRERSC